MLLFMWEICTRVVFLKAGKLGAEPQLLAGAQGRVWPQNTFIYSR